MRETEDWAAETLTVFSRVGADGEPLTTREVTEHLDCTRRAVYDRLQRLVDRGVLGTKKVGARGRIWWPTATSFTGTTASESNTSTATDAEDSDRRAGLRTELERKQYEAAMETIGDGVYIVDDESRFVFVNQAHTELTGYDRDELLGAHASIVTADENITVAEQRRDHLLTTDETITTVETELQTKGGESIPIETRFALFELDEDRVGRVGVVRDITERRADERQLETRIRQQEVVTNLGQLALECRDLDRLMRRAVTLVSETLDTDYCKILDLTDDGDELLLRQGVGWDDGIVGEATVSAVDDDSQAAHTLRTEQPIVVEDLERERRFSGPDLLTAHDVTSGISTIIGSFGNPWGILGTHDTAERTFTDHDVNFVQSVAHILSTAIDRHGYERELEHQREQLIALNDLRSVISGVTDAVIAQSTRDEIERVVCDRLADAETYQFASVSALDRSLDAVRIKAGSESAASEGATIGIGTRASSGYAEMLDEAIRTRTVQVRRHADIEAWSGAPETADDETVNPFESLPDGVESEIRSTAAIPIVHETMVFGVVTIWTTRAEAFADGERATIDHLGEIIGHAIASIERKRALMSDEVIELHYQTGDLPRGLGLADGMDGTVSIARTIPIDEGRYVSYGMVDNEAVEPLKTIFEAEPHWEELTIQDHGDDEKRFKLVLSEPPVTSAVAAHGGEVVEASIVHGAVHLKINLPPGADVRAISEVVKEAYPGIELVTRRQVSRVDPHIARVMDATLTDRQRAALEASYHAGFFEWPRDTSGEAVAETLDISPSTFHQHLRTAERKVFDSLLSRHH